MWALFIYWVGCDLDWMATKNVSEAEGGSMDGDFLSNVFDFCSPLLWVQKIDYSIPNSA